MANKFGDILKQARENGEIKMTASYLAKKLKITPAYLCDLEKGNRFPSKELLDNIVKELKFEGKEKYKIYDLVAIESSKGKYVSKDISKYIMENDKLRLVIRLAMNKNMNNSYWNKVVKAINNEGGNIYV